MLRRATVRVTKSPGFAAFAVGPHHLLAGRSDHRGGSGHGHLLGLASAPPAVVETDQPVWKRFIV